MMTMTIIMNDNLKQERNYGALANVQGLDFAYTFWIERQNI